MEDLIDLDDVTRSDVASLYELTDRLKADPEAFGAALERKTLLMLFAKPSTRTRLSFETGMTQLGGHAIFFGTDQSQLGRGEPISDTAKVASRYVDGVMARLFDHEDMVEFADHADVPVVNGLTDRLHPCQALADLYTLRERGLLGAGPLAYVGDGNNVANSLMQACATMDVPCRIATPEGYEPDAAIRERVSGADVEVTNDPAEAVEDAAAVYTDVWVSMGDEDADQRRADLEGFQVTAELMDRAREDAVFMHCLPAHRGEEVTADVIDGDRSVVFDQAENRMHVQKALLTELM